jgi:transcriptional regulator with XRE-family HTH domain
MEDNLIYGIVDPTNNMCVYVGKTTEGIKRPVTHLIHSHNIKLREWVSELRNNNLVPNIVILEKGLTLNNIDAKEVFWINEYEKLNPNLFNRQLLQKPSECIEYSTEDLQYLNIMLTDLSSVIKSVRYKFKITQQELADLCKVNRGTISEAERNNKINSELLIKIINVKREYMPADRAPGGWDSWLTISPLEKIETYFSKNIRIGRKL